MQSTRHSELFACGLTARARCRSAGALDEGTDVIISEAIDEARSEGACVRIFLFEIKLIYIESMKKFLTYLLPLVIIAAGASISYFIGGFLLLEKLTYTP